MDEEVGGDPNRSLAVASAVLTALALAGTVFDLFALTEAGPPGCASPVGILFILLAIVLGYLSLTGILAGAGLSLYLSFGSQWGPVLMIAANFLLMIFFGWGRLLSPGHPYLGITIVVLAATAEVSSLLLLRPLLRQGRTGQRLLKLLLLAGFALAIEPYYASGMAWDWSTAMQSPAPAVASADGPRC